MTLTYGPMDAYGDAVDAEGAPIFTQTHMPQSPWSPQHWLLGNPKQIHVPLSSPNAPVKMARSD